MPLKVVTKLLVRLSVSNVMICYSIASFTVTDDSHDEHHTILLDEEFNDSDVPMPGTHAVFSQNS